MSTVERLPKSLSAFFCWPLTLQQNLMWVTVLKPTVHRAVEYGLKIPIRYRFQWRRTTASWLLRTTWKKSSTQRCRTLWKLQNEMKNHCYFKVWKSVQFNSRFLWKSQNFYLFLRKVGDFFIRGLKKIVRLKQCPFYGFRFRNA